MILIAFESNVFPLAKLYPSENVDDWKEDDVDSTHIIPEKTEILLSSVKRRRRKTDEEKVFEKVLKKNIILLMNLMNRFLK